VARREPPAARFLFNSITIWSLAPLVYRFLAIFFAFVDEKTHVKKVIGGPILLILSGGNPDKQNSPNVQFERATLVLW